MEFHGTKLYFIRLYQSSMEFHGIFHGIPCNYGAAICHLVPWIVILFNTMSPWTCKGYSMEFHGTLESPYKKPPSFKWFHGIRRAPCQMTQVFHGIPWNISRNSMELWYRQMKYNSVPRNSMEFHGTLVPPNEILLSSMEFHGTLRLSFYSIPCYPGLAWDIPWNSMELWSRQNKKITVFHGIP